MKTQYNAFLQILNASIHNKVTKEDVLNQLTAQDLLEVLRFSDIHHVTPLVYNQIGKTEAFLQLPSKERENYKKRALRMVTEQMNIPVIRYQSFRFWVPPMPDRVPRE